MSIVVLEDDRAASSLALEECSLSERGRELVEELVDAYVEVVIPEGDYETHEAARERAADHGFELIPEGANRDVFVVPPRLLSGERTCVVKIPRWLPGAYENAKEIENWHTLPDDVRRHLAPVFDYGIGWLIMPYASRDLTKREQRQLRADIRAAGYTIDDLDVEANVDVELNYGRVDGVPVVIDYGKGCVAVESDSQS